MKSGGTVGHEAGGHELEDGIFVAGNMNLTRKRSATRDNVLSHAESYYINFALVIFTRYSPSR